METLTSKLSLYDLICMLILGGIILLMLGRYYPCLLLSALMDLVKGNELAFIFFFFCPIAYIVGIANHLVCGWLWKAFRNNACLISLCLEETKKQFASTPYIDELCSGFHFEVDKNTVWCVFVEKGALVFMTIFVLAVIISGVLSLPYLCCAAIVLAFIISVLWLFLTSYCESSCCKEEQRIREKYYQAYYYVQQLSKKEDISIMEAQVAFLQAMSLPIALVAMVNQLAPDPVNCVVRVFFLILFLGIFPMVYHRVKKIHSRVWEDYEFLLRCSNI